MNIFTVDHDPTVAAQQLCDKHIVKMPLETAQMLCSAFDPLDLAPYKRVHYNHPCTQWARQSEANFDWLVQHGLALCAEYTKRYGSDMIQHASEVPIKWCKAMKRMLSFPDTGLTEHPQCFGDYQDRCYVPGDPIAGYRRYYRTAKRRFAKWATPTAQEPSWFNENVDLALREGQL